MNLEKKEKLNERACEILANIKFENESSEIEAVEIVSGLLEEILNQNDLYIQSLPTKSPSLVTQNINKLFDEYVGEFFQNPPIKNSTLDECYVEEVLNDLRKETLDLFSTLLVKEGEKDSEDWISVEEGLPDEGNWYLVMERGQVNFLFYDSEKIWLSTESTESGSCEWRFPITHWMPLPNPPKQEQQKTGNNE